MESLAGRTKGEGMNKQEKTIAFVGLATIAVGLWLVYPASSIIFIGVCMVAESQNPSFL